MTRRREFPTSVKRAAWNRAAGTCECHRVPELMKLLKGIPCGCKLGAGNTFYEHILQDGAGGAPILDNCAVLVRTCWRLKTDKLDRPVVADVKRLADRHRNIKAQSYRPLIGTKASGIALRFRGPPLDRRTGQPWGRR
jgi:hypothetical protein